ncbi:MAG: IPT/TIG domain-containing protein, partial [Myxococcales bacterium]|nr:IPT/TIG domain-containing protein [Myxococcales bacterium]
MSQGLDMRALRSALLAVTLLGLAQGCSCGKPSTQADSGTPDASVETDAGAEDAGEEFDAGMEEDAGPPPMLALRRLLPPRGSSAGGTPVLLEGSAFLRDFAGTGSQARPLTSIKVGSNPVLDFQIIDDETIELRTPPGTAGPASVTLTNPNGSVICNNCFTYFDDLVVTSFAPREGPLAGGTEVTLNGQGFTQDTQVLFGNFSSPRITFVSSSQLKAVAPRGAVADLVDVVVYNKNGVNTQRRSYRYVSEPVLTSLSPMTGPVAGGTVVTVTGAGLSGVTAVRFGALDGTALSVASDASLTVTTPAAASTGAVDVTLVTPLESRTYRNAFAYVDSSGAFAVFGVFPHVVRAGDTVSLTGQALDQGTLTVSLGGQAATVVSTTFSTATVTVPARGSAPRKSDVVVTGAGTATLTGGATWRIGLTSVTPTSGPAAGGTSLTVVGSALPADAEAKVGTFAATGVTVTGETGFTATTAAGSGGAASDLTVREAADPENEAVLAGAFTYLEPLSIGRVQPERGAIAGGTLVTVLGAGFGDATVVSFGSARAKDLKVIDSHTLTCRTPKAAQVGVVDVKVERLTENDTLPGGFSYFDPRSISGGLSGGPLVGTLNITVL